MTSWVSVVWWAALAGAQEAERMDLELPAVGTSAAVAEGPGLVLEGGVSSVVLPPAGELSGLPVVPRLGVGYLGGPVHDALVLGGVTTWAGTVDDAGQPRIGGEARLTAAVGSPQRTAWVGADIGVGVHLDGGEALPQVLGAGTLAVDFDALTSLTVRLGAAASAAGVEPRLGLGVVYRPGLRSSVAVGAQGGRRSADQVASRYPATAHVLVGGRIGPELEEPRVEVEVVSTEPEDLVDEAKHPAIRCLPGDISTGRPPPLGVEGWCVRVSRNGEVTRHGMYVKFHRDGVVAVVGEYTMGRRSGQWQWTSFDGTPEESGSFVDDVESGLWVKHFASGGVEEETEMVSGKPHGSYRLFHRSGSLAVAGRYEMGQRVGSWFDYDEGGGLTRERVYVDGRLQTQRLPDNDEEKPEVEVIRAP